jgi:prepilin-type N-terminal cleavage/methylation domain-containing protein/prepilin-type processing-associated H-X9-DG protein
MYRLANNCGRRAYTLIELLLVIAIIGILIALSSSAITKVQTTAAQVSCANYLRQIGIAMLHHHTTHRVFPSNGGWDGKQQIKAADGSLFTPTVTEPNNPPPHHFGVGTPGQLPRFQTGSRAYAILPFLEQEAVYRGQAWTTPVSPYICPSRRHVDAQAAPASDQYATYLTGGWEWGKIDYAANALVIPNRPKVMSLVQITDGASNTILIGEKAMDRNNYETGTWFWDEPFFIGGAGGTERSGTLILKDDRGIKFPYNWGSPHTGGAQFVFADGSVHTLSYSMSQSAVKALLTPAGGEQTPDF